MTPQSRTVVIVGSIVSALLLAALIVGAILLYSINKQADEADYRACMETRGIGLDSSVPEMVDAAEWCSSR